MKYRILTAALLSATLLLAPQVKSWAEEVATTKATPDEASSKKVTTVSLTIDYNDGAQLRFPAITWQEKMTVLSALEVAGKHPRGIKFEQRGKGATTMVTKIDDLKNSGADGKNWVFRVGDKLGDRSCGIFPVKAGDRILWKFERYK